MGGAVAHTGGAGMCREDMKAVEEPEEGQYQANNNLEAEDTKAEKEVGHSAVEGRN